MGESAGIEDGVLSEYGVQGDGKIWVVIPKYLNYPNQNRRWPLPLAMVLVPDKDTADSLARCGHHVKEEINVKELVIIHPTGKIDV